jgi:hypothetical protein
MVLVGRPAMVEAVQTTTSTFGIWAIVIVSVVVLAFWLVAITLADRSQVRASGPRRTAGESRGAWTGGSVSGEQATEIPGEPVHEPIGVRSWHVRDESVPEGEMPTRDDLPAQPAALRDAPPRQRTGDADRAARRYAGPAARDDTAPDDTGTGR